MARGIYKLSFKYNDINHEEMSDMLRKTYFISDNCEVNVILSGGESSVKFTSDEFEDILNVLRAANLICHGFVFGISIASPIENVMSGFGMVRVEF